MPKRRATATEERLHLADRLGLRVSEAARALGVSERQLRQILPELPHTRLGGCVVLPVDALRQWLLERVQVEKSRIDTAVDEILASIKDE